MEVKEEVQVSLVEQQRRSLPGDLVTLMDSATVSAITHRVPVSKEKLRNRPPPTLWEVSCQSLCQVRIFEKYLKKYCCDNEC